jgi:colanic acid biosynthesis glycosyl transferase WcaI
MRVGILTQYYPPEMGAPQARLSELAREFVNQGHEVVVLTAMPNYPTGKIHDGYGGLFRQSEQDGVRVLRSFIFPTQKIGMVPRLTNYFSFVCSSAAIGAVKFPRVDYLITESPPLFLGLSGFALSRLKRAKWIFNVSDLWPDGAVRLGLVSEGLTLDAALKLEAFCYRYAWLVTGQSQEILANINDRFPTVDTYHLSNGVDTTRFTPDLRSTDARRELCADPERECVAVYAGLHGVAQGLDQVLDAAEQLGDLDNLTIVFIGDGPERQKLVARARGINQPKIRFLGPRDRDAIPRLVASADIALVPLAMRIPGAVPSKVYEAMASAIPVLLAAEGEAARIVERAQAGIAVAPGDSTAIARALRKLATEPATRKAAGERGRAAAIERYDSIDIARRFIERLADDANDVAR